MEKRKVLGTIIGVLAFIALIAGISFAWFSWQSSNNTLVSFTVEGVDITFDAGADITSSKLRPVSTKEVGVSKGYAIKKTITASSPLTAYLNLYLTLETLPDVLKHESFIWELYKESELVGKGNFKNNNQGDKVRIASSQKITSTTSTYDLYIWIDGNNCANPETMQNQTFKFVLSADATDQEPLVPDTETISNIYNNAEKTTVVNNSVEYQYATSVGMMEDVGGNIRYYGADPNNYVSFNNELWRIIGVFTGIDDGTGNTETRIKIARNESIGNYQWDDNENEWSTSTLQTYLNGTYLNGLTSEAQGMVDNAKWNLGSSSTHRGLYANDYYTFERGTTVYSGRSTEWIGKIALMYPSDYMYAGDLSKCSKGGSIWDTDQTNCRNTSWLRSTSTAQWTLTPNSGSPRSVFAVYKPGYVLNFNFVTYSHAALPVLYLASTVEITGGEGTSENPFTLN